MKIFRFFGFEIAVQLPKFLRRDRRKAERQGVFEALYVDYESDDKTVQGSGEARDISTGGCRFTADTELAKGLMLNLTLRFAPGAIRTEVLQVRARVVRSYVPIRRKHYFMGKVSRYYHPARGRHHRVACQFVSLDQAGYEIIKSFVEWLKEREKKYLFYRGKPGT